MRAEPFIITVLAGVNGAGKSSLINQLAGEPRVIVSEIAGTTAFVAGSMGPLGKALVPFGPVSAAEAEVVFRTQAEGLLEGGLDVFDSHVGVTGFPMGDGFFEMMNPFAHLPGPSQLQIQL